MSEQRVSDEQLDKLRKTCDWVLYPEPGKRCQDGCAGIALDLAADLRDCRAALAASEQLGAGCVVLGAERTRERDAALARAERAEAVLLAMWETWAPSGISVTENAAAAYIAEIRARRSGLPPPDSALINYGEGVEPPEGE